MKRGMKNNLKRPLQMSLACCCRCCSKRASETGKADDSSILQPPACHFNLSRNLLTAMQTCTHLYEQVAPAVICERTSCHMQRRRRRKRKQVQRERMYRQRKPCFQPDSRLLPSTREVVEHLLYIQDIKALFLTLEGHSILVQPQVCLHSLVFFLPSVSISSWMQPWSLARAGPTLRWMHMLASTLTSFTSTSSTSAGLAGGESPLRW